MVATRMAVMQLPLAAAYGASKRAMVAYADALRLELGTHRRGHLRLPVRGAQPHP